MTCWDALSKVGNVFQYLKAIEQYPLLTEEEESKIGRNITDEGREILVLSHLRLAASMARNFVHFGFAHDELISVANIGLMRAVGRFDPEKGRFTSIAQPYIHAELAEHTLKNHRMVNIATTKRQRKVFYNLNRIRAEQIAKTGSMTFSMDQVDEVSKLLNVPTDEVIDMDVKLRARDVALDPLLEADEDERFSYGRYIADSRYDPENVMMRLEREWAETDGVEEALAKLDDRTAFIVRHRYMVDEPLTLHELSTIFGISGERVRQIEVKGLNKIREHLKAYA